MENFNKASLESAVKKYGQLHVDGKAEEDVKAEIAKDSRGFTVDQVNEIYTGIVGVKIDPEIPEWVEAVLMSNSALVESNQKVIDALESLKSISVANSGMPIDFMASEETKNFDESAKYIVAEGKSFSDRSNFMKKYKEGDDVTSLGSDRLKILLDQGLIVMTS